MELTIGRTKVAFLNADTDVPALLCGPLALHENKWGGPAGFRITHRKSGWCLAKVATLDEGLWFLPRLAAVDWPVEDCTPQAIQKKPSIRAAVARIKEEFDKTWNGGRRREGPGLSRSRPLWHPRARSRG
jgi:hypothetical protein